MKTYAIIYADPPWEYKDQCHAGKRGAGYKYALLKDTDIRNLPVARMADDNCALFLWATFPKLPEAIEVIRAWGFEYKTLAFNWVKTNKNTDTHFWGMGNWTRSNSEICLLGIKGKPVRVSRSVHSVVRAPIEEHSKKPDLVRTCIVELFGDLPRVELFARQEVPGWDCWGNQVSNSIDLSKYVAPVANGLGKSGA